MQPPRKPPRRLSTGPGRIADGSFTGARLHSASVRAIDSYHSIQRIASRLNEELDNVTSPHGIPTTDLGEDDSAVTAVNDALQTLRGKQHG